MENHMAYFYCATEGADYAERYCRKCGHTPDPDSPGFGCPVMDAHWLYSYQLCNAKEHPGKLMLDMLIPMDEHNNPGPCAMFQPLGANERFRQALVEIRDLEIAETLEIIEAVLDPGPLARGEVPLFAEA